MILELFIAAQAVFDAARFNRRPTGELDAITPAEPVLRLGEVLGHLEARCIEGHHSISDIFEGDSDD